MKKVIITFVVLGIFVIDLSASGQYPYLMCKMPSDKFYQAGCIKVYEKNGKSCSDSKGTVCVQKNQIKDLCVETGKKVGIDFTLFASGQGSFKTEASCIQKCNKQYGGIVEEFGGKCLGLVIN